MRTIAFVTPWYGESIRGGAESELRGLVGHLSAAGIDCEILTTCVRDFSSDWNVNYHRAGTTLESGARVRRFPVRRRDTARFHEVNDRLMRGMPLSEAEERAYLAEMIHSPELCAYIAANRDRYELFVFIPYMFGTSYYGVQACRDKAVMIPCLHDESYAYLRPYREEYSRLAGMIFHSEPESELAKRLYGLENVSAATLGEGLDTDIAGDPRRFREKYGLSEPFVLYAGRKDAGKNVDQLIRYFTRWKQRCPTDTKLVLIGGGEIEIPAAAEGEILDLGYVSVQDKYDACAAALLLCQPSRNESFSLVIMESWLCGRPVLVSADCAVTRNFAVKSGGGLYFRDYPDFEACLEYLRSNSELADRMGRSGGAFVRANFSWPVIVSRYTAFFEALAARSE